MDPMWMVVRYLFDLARYRARVVLDGDSGALTLEWLVIAAILVAAAGATAAIFKSKVVAYANSLP
jgi:CRISPR/Cas system-associated protein Csx1